MCVSCLYLCTFVPETFLGKSISSVIWLSRSIDWLTHKPLHPFFRHTHFYACRNRTTNENDSLIVLLCVYVNKWVFTLRILLTSVSRKKWTRNRLIFDSMYQVHLKLWQQIDSHQSSFGRNATFGIGVCRWFVSFAVIGRNQLKVFLANRFKPFSRNDGLEEISITPTVWSIDLSINCSFKSCR